MRKCHPKGPSKTRAKYEKIYTFFRRRGEILKPSERGNHSSHNKEDKVKRGDVCPVCDDVKMSAIYTAVHTPLTNATLLWAREGRLSAQAGGASAQAALSTQAGGRIQRGGWEIGA